MKGIPVNIKNKKEVIEEDTKDYFYGIVTNNNNKPVSDVLVKLIRNGDIIDFDFTDDKGEYKLRIPFNDDYGLLAFDDTENYDFKAIKVNHNIDKPFQIDFKLK